MGKDVEEGEISDMASVEEISGQDFNIKQDEVVKEAKSIKVGGGEGAAARVWTMRDLYNKYPTICRGYGPGLHNLAWAQAVQNKPLNEIFVREVEQDDVSKPASSVVSSVNSIAAAAAEDDKRKVVIDDREKEEGELEEGEIEMDLESESNEKVNEQVKLNNVESIREALESVVNVVDGDK